jgi:hypothetical protein
MFEVSSAWEAIASFATQADDQARAEHHVDQDTHRDLLPRGGRRDDSTSRPAWAIA